MIRFPIYRNTLILSILLFTACDNSLEDDKRYAEEKVIESYISSKSWTYTKSNGVYHIAIEPSYNYEVNEGDTVEFWFTGYTPKTTPLVFDTNVKTVAVAALLDTNTRTFEPLRVVAGKTDLVEGLKRGLLLTRLNEQSTIIFTSDIGFKDQIVGPLTSWSSLAFDIEVIYLNGEGIISEKQILSNMDLSTFAIHTSGLYYKSIIDTSTVHPTDQNTVYGWYRCTLPNGTIIDEISTANAEINLTDEEITDALKIGFTLVSLGGTSEFVAPSPLCFGKTGNNVVEPYQTLIYSIRLDSIK